MAPAASKVRASSWDQTDILLGEIARCKKVVNGPEHQRGHRDAVEFRATVESQDGVEPARLNLRPAQIATVARFSGGQLLMVFVDPVGWMRAELRVGLPAQLFVQSSAETQQLLPIGIATGDAATDQQ